MIGYDFLYYQPKTINEAIRTYQTKSSEQKRVIFYGGGTEFISKARRNELNVDVVIDLKSIPECNEFKVDNNKIIIGSAVTLSTITDSSIFPLLADVSRGIATRTARNKITIGGNIASHLIYKEAILPLLLCDSEIIVACVDGVRKVAINDLLSSEYELKDGEFIVQIHTNEAYRNLPHYQLKKTKHSKVNYPIVSVCAIQCENHIRIALSGVCTNPFRLKQMEEASIDTIDDKKIKEMIEEIPTPIIEDMFASKDYRIFTLEKAISKTLQKMEATYHD